jgi:hypothetical protein
VHPPPSPGWADFPSWWNVRQKVAIATQWSEPLLKREGTVVYRKEGTRVTSLKRGGCRKMSITRENATMDWGFGVDSMKQTGGCMKMSITAA